MLHRGAKSVITAFFPRLYKKRICTPARLPWAGMLCVAQGTSRPLSLQDGVDVCSPPAQPSVPLTSALEKQRLEGEAGGDDTTTSPRTELGLLHVLVPNTACPIIYVSLLICCSIFSSRYFL